MNVLFDTIKPRMEFTKIFMCLKMQVIVLHWQVMQLDQP